MPLAERTYTVGFGKSYPEFWLNARPLMCRMTLAITSASAARDEAAVIEFHSIALKFGC